MFRVTIYNILVIILLIIMLSYRFTLFYFSPCNLLGERLDKPCFSFIQAIANPILLLLLLYILLLIYIYECLCVCLYVHVCIYVCVYINIYVYIYIHESQNTWNHPKYSIIRLSRLDPL